MKAGEDEILPLLQINYSIQNIEIDPFNQNNINKHNDSVTKGDTERCNYITFIYIYFNLQLINSRMFHLFNN